MRVLMTGRRVHRGRVGHVARGLRGGVAGRRSRGPSRIGQTAIKVTRLLDYHWSLRDVGWLANLRIVLDATCATENIAHVTTCLRANSHHLMTKHR